MRTLHNKQAGFTLVEMIVVIVITGIIGGMVAMFIRAPVQGYVDSARRAELTDIADTAMRRMARDVRTAVPNSLRSSNCTAPCVEFLPTKAGGRYRAQTRPDGTGDVLNFVAGDPSFDIVGSAINFAANDYIVVGSTQSDGVPPYSTAATGVLRAYAGAAGPLTSVSITNAVGLPVWAELPSQHFSVVDGTQRAVTYACENQGRNADGNGTGQLMRYSNYGFNVTPANGAILANKVEFCDFDYSVSNQRFGLLAVSLTLTSGGESVTLYNEIHVNNAP
jgi:MSHA biogenesis protein MshO